MGMAVRLTMSSSGWHLLEKTNAHMIMQIRERKEKATCMADQECGGIFVIVRIDILINYLCKSMYLLLVRA